MSRTWSPPGRGAALVLCGLALAGCHPNQNFDTPFPAGVDFQPLEPILDAATFPAATTGDLHPEGLGPIVPNTNFAHWTSHARGYVHAPLARVYAALHVPDASFIHNDGGAPRLERSPELDVEPQFPISFRVHYVNPTVIGDVRFEVTYRGGPLTGTDAAPVEVGVCYQQTSGTQHIPVMTGSLVARAVGGSPDVTEVEMIAWLKADTQGQSDCDGTLSDLFGDLVAVLATLPP
jgi:hypothetical protein